MFKNTIRQRLLWLSLVPFLLILLASAILIRGSYARHEEARVTRNIMAVAMAAGDLIHALQIERGTTSGYLKSEGKKFMDRLPVVRADGDIQRERIRAEAGKLAAMRLPRVHDALARALTQLAGLEELRTQADRQALAADRAVSQYTAWIAVLKEVIQLTEAHVQDPDNLRRITSYLSLVNAKERAGQERALVTGLLGGNQASQADILQVQRLVAMQESHADMFRIYADRDMRVSLERALASPAADGVRQMRTALLTGPVPDGIGLDAEEWFRAASTRIADMHATEQELSADISAHAAQAEHEARSALMVYVAVVLGALLGGVVATLKLTAGIVVPLHRQVTAAEEIIQSRDLTRKVPAAGPDEVMRAAEAFNDLIQYFHDTIAELNQSSQYMAGVSTTLSGTSHEMQLSAAAQTDAAAAVVSAIEEASTNISATSSHTESVAGLVNSARTSTEETIQVMGNTVQQIRAIVGQIESASENVTSLLESSERIGGIVRMIQEIAEQTNLLALNAAIEAARAGEQGRGFAVVADEVRKLAERATSSTKEIGQVIQVMQAGVQSSVASMTSATNLVNDSVRMVNDSESVLNRIDRQSREANESVRSIAMALKAQEGSIHQVAVSIEKIAHMAERNDEVAEATERLAQEMSQLTTTLSASVSRFRT
ncbi:MAG TPA: methyl-accepting chemotaxis protein [Thiobacillaceae bacterium]|nr:methyl-accepting chemotaxis protein [Thiobacillaceae bacterium]HNU63074.1 methyl-accepting chemotaxis protein [Thiobacillaceae bacterium]